MDKVKNVPELRFEGFTDDWKQRKLGEVFEQTITYIDPSKENIELYTLSVEKGLTEKTERYNRQFLVTKNDKFKLVNFNEFAFNPMNITLGAFGLNQTRKKIAISGYYVTMYAREEFDDYYFKTWLVSDKAISLYKACATGTLTEKQRVQFPAFSEIKTYIPPLLEQKAIGEFFKQLDSTIDFHQREWEKYKNLKISYLQKMFPRENENKPQLRFSGFSDAWVQRKLSEISVSYSGGTPSVTNHEFYNGTIPFIRSGEINYSSTELFINEEGLNQSSAKMVSKGDILYALYGATSGEVGISKINGAINQAILAIKPLKNFDANFVSQWLRKNKQNIIQTFLQGGQGNLSGDIVKNLNLTIPKSLAEQQAIGEFFRQVDNTITTHQRELEKYKKLKEGYLQKMFI